MTAPRFSRWVRSSEEDAKATASTLVSALARVDAWTTTEQEALWRPLLQAPEPVRKAAVAELLRRIAGRVRGTRYDYDADVGQWDQLLRALLPFPLSWGPQAPPALWSPDELADLLRLVVATLDAAKIEAMHLGAGPLVETAIRNDLTHPELLRALEELANALHRNAHDRDMHARHRELGERIAERLGIGQLHEQDAWRRVLSEPDDELSRRLLAAADVAPAKPSTRFARRRDELLAEFGRQTCRERLLAWTRALSSAKARADEPPVIPAETVKTMIGLAQLTAAFGDAQATAALADLGIAGYRKIAHFGALAAPLGTACSRLLAERPDALSQLARMHQRTRHPPSKAKLDKLLGDVAERLGVSAAELTEIVVDDYGLDRHGRLWREIADAGGELRIEGNGVTTRWHAAGRVTKTAPAALRDAHADAVGEVRAQAKAIRDALAVQRARLENLLREDREWTYGAWQVRYLEHGLVATIARRLAWRLADDDGERPAVCVDGRLIGLDGAPLPEPAEHARVRLWHPAGAPDGERETLRRLLADGAVEQPFDQLERDVFRPVADDAHHAGVRRFAGTRVRQHQLAAILTGRGWRYNLRSAVFDSDDHPRLELPAWDLGAVLTLTDDGPDAQASERSILLDVTCDDVRFVRGDTLVNPHDVPLVAFSEVLRDVALVVHAAA